MIAPDVKLTSPSWHSYRMSDLTIHKGDGHEESTHFVMFNIGV